MNEVILARLYDFRGTAVQRDPQIFGDLALKGHSELLLTIFCRFQVRTRAGLLCTA